MQCVHKEPVVCVKVIYLGRLLGGCHGFYVRLSFCVVVVITNFLGENTSSLTKSTGTSVRIEEKTPAQKPSRKAREPPN